MKFKRSAQAVALALLVAACSGDEPQQASPTTTAVAEVEVTTTVPPTTQAVAAPTTAVATTAPAPNSLAFASARDVGRLFEVAGAEATFANAGGGDAQGQIAPGTLVQATSAKNRDGALWVRVRETTGDLNNLGWLRADRLSPTSLFSVVDDPAQSGELRVARRSNDPISVVRTPGGTDEVLALQSQQVAMHGGSQALAADGETYLDVIDPASQTRIGWVRAASFSAIRSNLAQTQDHEPLRTRADRTVTYGAPLQSVSITQVGCNASRVTFTNPSVALGLAVVLGQDVPTGRMVGSQERWSAPSGGVLYVGPGDTATLTLPSDTPRTWYFAGLDEQLRAEAPRAADGTLSGAADGPVATTRSESIFIPGGACAYIEPTPDPSEADPFGLALEEQNGTEQPASSGPDGSESSTTGEGDLTDSGVEGESSPTTTRAVVQNQSTGQSQPGGAVTTDGDDGPSAALDAQ